MKIILTVKGKDIKLTMEDARALYNELGSIFPNKETIIYRDRPYYNPLTYGTCTTTLTANNAISNTDNLVWTSSDATMELKIK